MPISLAGAPYCTSHTGSVCQWGKNFPRYSRSLDQPLRNPHRRLIVLTFDSKLSPRYSRATTHPMKPPSSLAALTLIIMFYLLFELTQQADRACCYSSFVFQIVIRILNFCLVSQFTVVFVVLFSLSVSFSSFSLSLAPRSLLFCPSIPVCLVPPCVMSIS